MHVITPTRYRYIKLFCIRCDKCSSWLMDKNLIHRFTLCGIRRYTMGMVDMPKILIKFVYMLTFRVDKNNTVFLGNGFYFQIVAIIQAFFVSVKTVSGNTHFITFGKDNFFFLEYVKIL